MQKCGVDNKRTGRPKSIKNPKSIKLNLPESAKKKLYRAASARGVSQSVLVTELIGTLPEPV